MDSARAIRWCSTMADAPRMDYKQLRRSKKLIRKLCCNYDHGNCLALDDGEPCVCVQGISYSLLCNWFRNAVLPADHELLADVMRERPENAAPSAASRSILPPTAPNIAPPVPSGSGESRTPNASVNNTGTSANRDWESPVLQGFFMPDCKWLRHSIRKLKTTSICGESPLCRMCFLLRRGAIFLKGDHHG